LPRIFSLYQIENLPAAIIFLIEGWVLNRFKPSLSRLAATV
jgi:hypothetical protein